MKIAFCAFLVFFTSLIFAAKINGTISDAETKELLIGAAIILESSNSDKTYQAISGLDGSYSISGIAPGSCKLIISYIGFLDIAEQITFSSESEVMSWDFSIASNAAMLSEVIIRADNQGTDAQARSLEKQSASVINIISSKQIMISPDITVANVIQHVSGLFIERNASGDPQYAIVRGMDKRYNNTLVNGIKIPSPDNENRFVPLDKFPAMEADAIGGTVNMVMKNAPYQFVLDGDVQIGYNQLNFERDFATYDRSKLNRKSPKEIHGRTYRATSDDFPVENMIADYVTPLPDVLASMTCGDRFMGKKLLVMLGGSFENSYRPVSNYFYDPSVNFFPGNPLIMQGLIERETSSQFQRIAFHGKLDYDINPPHNINFYFRINNTAVTDLSPLAGYTTLTYFNANSALGITDISPIEANTGLKEIILRDVKFGNAGMTTIPKFVNLYRINMRSSRVTSYGILAELMALGALLDTTPGAAAEGDATLDLRGNTADSVPIEPYRSQISNIEGC